MVPSSNVNPLNPAQGYAGYLVSPRAGVLVAHTSLAVMLLAVGTLIAAACFLMPVLRRR